MINLEDLDTKQKAYAAHNRLHAEYSDTHHTARKKTQVQEEHEAVVGKILELGGSHTAKENALDDTLPQELREQVKLHYLSDSIELDKKTKLSEIQILRTGTFYHSHYGKFSITDETLEAMVRNFGEGRPKPPTELVVDFEHLSAITITDPKQGRAAGWVKGLALKESELFATVEWTEEAAEAIGKKEFRFISPEFDLNYRNPETGKSIGPTLLAVALTNRPFLEGMEPVVLSKSLGSMIFSEDESYYEKEDTVRRAYNAQFPGPIGREWTNSVTDIYDDFVVVSEGGVLYKLPYTKDETSEEVTFDTANKVKVKLNKIYEEIQLSEVKFKEWDAKYINDLPDKCFAYIEPGGEKDEDGKTVPRALRYLPYRGADGEVDLPHLRNALARLPQTKLSPEEKAKARKVLISAAREAGVGEYSKLPGVTENEWKEDTIPMEKKLRELLGLSEEDDIVEAVKTLKATSEETETLKTQITRLEGKVTAAEEKTQQTELKLTGRDADDAVADALAKGKITPKQETWAKTYALRDPEGFKGFVETAEKVGPELKIIGKETEIGDIQLTEQEKASGKKLGVSEEELIEQKKQDKETPAE